MIRFDFFAVFLQSRQLAAFCRFIYVFVEIAFFLWVSKSFPVFEGWVGMEMNQKSGAIDSSKIAGPISNDIFKGTAWLTPKKNLGTWRNWPQSNQLGPVVIEGLVPWHLGFGTN